LINHQFVPQDFDDEYCEQCDKHSDRHANIEGITHEDEILDYGASLSDITGRYSTGPDEW
jgi:hypothetical protein